jgi:ribosome-associated protein
LLEIVESSLDDDKAQQIATIDLAGKSTIADYMVIASGRSQRHVGALADNLVRRLKGKVKGRPKVEGRPQCDWVLIDAGDIVVHLFRPEVRTFYNLEKLWSVRLPPPEQAAV